MGTTKPKAKPKMRYESNELALIKNVFHENSEILMAMRKVFFQVKLERSEMELLKPITQSKEVMALLRKTYLPELELDAPVGQLIDLWLTVDNAEKTPMEAVLALRVRERLMQHLEAGLKRFKDLGAPVKGIIVDYKPNFDQDDEEGYVEFIARNALITHTEFQLAQIRALSEKKEETVEEAKKRMGMDSAR